MTGARQGMPYREAFEQASELAKNALDHMSELRIAPHPDNFEVWYAYQSKVDAELTRKLEQLLETDSADETEAYLDIKRTFLGDDREGALEATSQEAGAAIQGALQTLNAAASNAKDYGDKLAHFSGDMQSADGIKAQALVAKLLADTRQVMERNAELEAELQSAGEQIEQLRDNLDDARKASETDGLTGLPNRRAFDLQLTAAIARAQSDAGPLTLIVADVDRFKRFNDSFGHAVGDEVLKLVGRALGVAAKGVGTPARYGGEEFCVVLPNTTMQTAVATAEQLRKAIAAKSLKSMRTGENYGQVTLSFGVAALGPTDTADSLYERADAALYLAKRTGRNRTCTQDDLETAKAAG